MHLSDVSSLPNRYSHHTLSELTCDKCQLATDLPQITDIFLSNLLPLKVRASSNSIHVAHMPPLPETFLATLIEETTLLIPYHLWGFFLIALMTP